MWINQWPLTREKIQAIEELVKQQLEKGHIEESNSPWTSPVFVVKKKSGKWRLLQDLRAVNSTMHDMRALQPGLPSPVALSKRYYITVIDLQDCFFTVKLHPEDSKRFAFSIPSVNLQRPYRRFQWKVLPQGMKNSPTLCQKFVDKALLEVRELFPQAYILHFMDDILIAMESKEQTEQILKITIKCLTRYGLIVAPEKIQHNRPLSYLGHLIYKDCISSQKVTLRLDKLKTLNDYQKLLGDINWVRPYLKLTTGDLSPLFNILKGDTRPNSPRVLTPEALQAIALVEERLTEAKVQQLDYTKKWEFLILKTAYTPTGCLWQEGVLEWIYLPHTQTRMVSSYLFMCSMLIIKARTRSKELFGKEMQNIIVPFNRQQFEQLLQNDEDWGIALQGYTGQIKYHLPRHPLIEFAKNAEFVFLSNVSKEPLQKALLLFTDGSSNGREVVYREN